MSLAEKLGVPVILNRWVEGIYYVRGIGLVAKDAETVQEFLDWLNKANALGDRCVAELEALLARWKAERRIGQAAERGT